ncbi:sulfur carrier protein ThiS [soil metagenome]
MREPGTATIILNGAPRALEEGQTVADLVGAQTGRQITVGGRAADGSRLGVAVARNAQVVPRSQWVTTVLRAGDDIEIVTAVQGG